MSTSCLNTEDYNYLINNQDIITTCHDALLEQQEQQTLVSLRAETAKNANDAITIANNSNNACTMPPLPDVLDRGVSAKGGKKDGVGSSSVTGTDAGAGAKDAKAITISDFADWLTGVERRLDGVCLCAEARDVEAIKVRATPVCIHISLYTFLVRVLCAIPPHTFSFSLPPTHACLCVLCARQVREREKRR